MTVKNIIQIAPDSSGKKLDTRELTLQGGAGTDTVQRQVVCIGKEDNNYTVNVDAFGQIYPIIAGGDVSIKDAVYSTRKAYVSEYGRLRIGSDTILFYDAFDGTTLQHNLWNASDTLTMTIAQTGGFATLNSGAITTLNTNAQISTHKDFLFLAQFPIYLHFKLKTPNSPQANATMEAGFFQATVRSTPTDGTFFRWDPAGTFNCVVNVAGAETQTAMTAPSVNVVHTFEIIIQNRFATFIIDAGTPVTVNFPNTAPAAWSNQQCQGAVRVYTGAGAPGVAPQLSVSEFNVAQCDLQAGRDYEEQLAIGMGRGCWQKPVFATDWGQTASWSNTAQAGTTALTNTTAPNTWQTGLGGDFAIQQPTGSATDLLVFGYQVPVGRTLVVRHIYISQLVVTGAAGGANPTQLYWAAGFGSSALSLATAESPPTTWSRRVVPLGIQSMVATPAVGAVSSPAAAIDIDMNGGVGVVESGRYFHIMVKILGGTATAASFWRGTCTVVGTFE